MIQPGQSLTNPVTGETLVFRTTSAQTERRVGRRRGVRRRRTAPSPRRTSTRPRRRRSRSSPARSSSGSASKTIVARPGDRVVVPAGTPHRFRNAGEETAHFVCEVRPALGFEQLIETMFGLAADGKVNRKGMPNPLRLAVIARHHFDDVRLPFPPAWLQRLGLAPRRPRRPTARLQAHAHLRDHVHPRDAGGPHGHRRLSRLHAKENARMSTATARDASYRGPHVELAGPARTARRPRRWSPA